MRGDLIPGTGGARKFRFAKAGMGKRSGYRIISYYAADDVPVFLLDVAFLYSFAILPKPFFSWFFSLGDRFNLAPLSRIAS